MIRTYFGVNMRGPAFLTPLVEGWADRRRHGFPWRAQLYRYPMWKRALWRIGFACAFLVPTPTPKTEGET